VGGNKAGGRPHHSLSPFPPLPLSIPPKFSDKLVGGKVRSSEGEVPRLPPYKYHPAVLHDLNTT